MEGDSGEPSAVKSLLLFSLADIDLFSFVPGRLLAINFSQYKGLHLQIITLPNAQGPPSQTHKDDAMLLCCLAKP